jgi:predicted DsbA family dithiol-disulfide isomerase
MRLKQSAVSAVLNDQRSLSRDTFMDIANSLSLDPNEFRGCLDSQDHKAEIEEDQADATFLQINGTPTFVLGQTLNSQVRGTILRGLLPYPALEAQINELLMSTQSHTGTAGIGR